MARLTIEQKQKRKLTKAKNELIDIAKYQDESNKFSDSLSHLLSGKETMRVSFIELDEFFERNYDVHD